MGKCFKDSDILGKMNLYIIFRLVTIEEGEGGGGSFMNERVFFLFGESFSFVTGLSQVKSSGYYFSDANLGITDLPAKRRRGHDVVREFFVTKGSIGMSPHESQAVNGIVCKKTRFTSISTSMQSVDG